MRISAVPVAITFFACLASCEEKSAPPAPGKVKVADLAKAEIPILSLKEGDYWKYKVIVEIPEGITSEGAAAIEIEQEKTRIYKGKVFVAEGYPEVDAFDVSAPGQPVERELVEIYEDKIMMRGSAFPGKPESEPVWLNPAVPFVSAGIRAGQDLAKLGVQDGGRKRGIKVVAREKRKVPAGEFDSIRILMTGNDGKFEVRRTTWFVTGVGIVKEEKSRYADGKLIFRETTDLVETSVAVEEK